jgi:hypothetical protein
MKSAQAVVAERLLNEVDNLLQRKEPNSYRWAGQSPTSGWDCSGLMGWLLNRAGISVPDLSSDGYYRKCSVTPDYKWGEHLAPLLALAFQVSGGVANHVGYVMQDLGSRKVILNSTTQPMPVGLTWEKLKWFHEHVLAFSYINSYDPRYLNGSMLGGIVSNLIQYLVHQFRPSYHSAPTASHLPFYREYENFMSIWKTLTIDSTESSVDETEFEGDYYGALELGISPGTFKVYATDIDGYEGQEILVAWDDGDGLITDEDVYDAENWSGTVTYDNGPLTKAQFTLSRSGSTNRDIKIKFTLTNDYVSHNQALVDGALTVQSLSFNSYIVDRAREDKVYADYNSIQYAAILLDLILTLTYYEDYTPLLSEVTTKWIDISRLTHWLNGLFDAATENPEKGLVDAVTYLEGAYTTSGAVILTDRLQKLWLQKLGVTFEEGIIVEYRSDWEVRYLKRGVVDGVNIDFGNYAKALNELRAPTQSSMG